MGKDRKLAVGASNLNQGSVSTLQSFNTHKSQTHKLITPSERVVIAASTAHRRKIDDASSFRPGKIYVRDFKTAYHDEYKDPKTQTVVEYGMDTETTQKAWEESRRELRSESLKKLGGLAKVKFGNMANMIRAFKKNSGDTISITEFAELLRRRNLDVLFPNEDQDLVFESLKSLQGTAEAPTVSSMLKLVNETDPNYSRPEKNEDMVAMREFLADEVAKRKAESEANEIVHSRETEHAELMRKAVGQKTFGIEIKAQDMDRMVDDLSRQTHANQTHAKFSRFLRLTNMKLHAAPFYDMRNDSLEQMKKYVQQLDEKSMDTLEQLSQTKARERDALDAVLSRSTTLSNLNLSSNNRGDDGGYRSMSHSTSSPALRSGGLSQYTTARAAVDPEPQTISAPASPIPNHNPMSAFASPITKGASNIAGAGSGRRTGRNLAGSLDEANALEAAAKLNISTSSSNGVNLAPGDRAVGTSPDSTILHSPFSYSSSYYPEAGDFIDPRVRKERQATPESHIGKRCVNGHEVTDWYRIGCGGDVTTPRNVKGLSATEGEYRGRYTTTNGDYYPPLIYAPNMEVTRKLISDADARTTLLRERRHRRHYRSSENLSITHERLLRENLESQAREIKRSQKVNDDMINYSTSVFLNDLKSFKKQPLQMMMKKPNLTKSDHMWGGNINRGGKEHDSRDFMSTYSTSFVSPEQQGAIQPTLVLEDRITAIFGSNVD